MRLVDDGVRPGDVSAPIFAAPIEIRIDDHRLGHEGGAVALVEGQVIPLGADRVSENSGIPCQLPRVGPGVRIEQQLVGVEAVAGLRLERTMHPKPIEGSGAHFAQVAVEDFVGELRKLETVGLARAARVEQANLDLRRVGGKDGEVRALCIRRGAERIRLAFANFHLKPRPAALVRRPQRYSSPTMAGCPIRQFRGPKIRSIA